MIAQGIIVMNMIGKPRHAEKALAVGCDIICAQGTEGGGVSTYALLTLVLTSQAIRWLLAMDRPSLTGRW